MNSQRKTAIVTGSTKGIGNGIANKLAAKGFNVVITSRKEEQASKVAEEINAKGAVGKAIGAYFDLEKPESAQTLLEQSLNKFGRLDVLVNNALSNTCVFPLHELSDEQVSFALTSNITNILLLSRLAYSELVKTQGNIINISSVVVNRQIIGMPLYTIAKGALEQMTKVLASEWAKDHIRVNAINPGFVRSSALADFGVPEDVIEKSYEYHKQHHPLGRVGVPEDIGKLAAFVASDDAEFMTGSIINCDAGYSIQGVQLYQENPVSS